MQHELLQALNGLQNNRLLGDNKFSASDSKVMHSNFFVEEKGFFFFLNAACQHYSSSYDSRKWILKEQQEYHKVGWLYRVALWDTASLLLSTFQNPAVLQRGESCATVTTTLCNQQRPRAPTTAPFHHKLPPFAYLFVYFARLIFTQTCSLISLATWPSQGWCPYSGEAGTVLLWAGRV